MSTKAKSALEELVGPLLTRDDIAALLSGLLRRGEA